MPGPASGAAPALSVVIPYYRRFDALEAAVRSAAALAEALPGTEVVTVNDGSGTEPDWPAELAGAPVRHLSLEANGGAPAARNAGLAAARGEYLVFLDSDDALVADGVRAALGLLAARPELVAAGGGLQLVHDGAGQGSANGARMQEARMHEAGVHAVPALRIFRAADPVFALNPVGPLSKMVFRRGPVEAIGGFDTGLAACQDWDLYVRLMALGPIALQPEISAVYRVSADSITGNLDKGVRGREAFLAKNAGRPLWWRAVFVANSLFFFLRRRGAGHFWRLFRTIRPGRAGIAALLAPAALYFSARKLAAQAGMALRNPSRRG